jgi:hypothetical protein
VKEEAMAYVFFGLILLFAAISVTYLFANDFAHETLEILFPVVGAILLSGYLGFKSIYLDAPKPVKFSVPIAVLHDFAHGQIHGMAPRSIRHLPRFNEFRGADLLDTLSLYNDFKQQGFSEVLRDVSQEPNSPAEILVEHFVEYALLRWLCNPDVSVGYIPGQTSRLISSAGGGGGLRGDLVETPISGTTNDPNPLLQASPLKIPLPEGSEVVRSDDQRLAFQISTRHTTLTFRCSGGGMETLDQPIGKEAEHIYTALGLPDRVTGVRMLGFNIEVKATQSPFSRYSRQAKAEAEWIERLKAQIEKDFSWDRLRALYAAG